MFQSGAPAATNHVDDTTFEPHCLVTGSTGYVGSRLVPCLLERGMRIRVLVRSPAEARRRPWRDDVEVVRGDLTDAATLDAAFAGVDVVYHLVHAMGTADDFADAERRGAVNVAAAAPTRGRRPHRLPRRAAPRGRRRCRDTCVPAPRSGES